MSRFPNAAPSGRRSTTLGFALLAAALVLGACATRPDGTTVTLVDDVRLLSMSVEGRDPTEAQELQRLQRYARMRRDGAAAGAITGALAGILAVSDNRAAGAAGGAVVGAALGYLAGAYVANRNALAEDRRGDLNAQLTAARDAAREHEQARDRWRGLVAQRRDQINRLNADFRAGRISRDQYRAEVDRLEETMRIMDQAVRAAEDDVRMLEHDITRHQASGGAAPRSLTAERDRLQQQVADLQSQYAQLVAVAGQVPDEVGKPEV